MQKRMRCKAEGEAKYRSNLMVVGILANPTTKQVAFSAPRNYSHSIVAGGLEEMSYTTLFTPRTLFMISLESRASKL